MNRPFFPKGLIYKEWRQQRFAFFGFMIAAFLQPVIGSLVGELVTLDINSGNLYPGNDLGHWAHAVLMFQGSNSLSLFPFGVAILWGAYMVGVERRSNNVEALLIGPVRRIHPCQSCCTGICHPSSLARPIRLGVFLPLGIWRNGHRNDAVPAAALRSKAAHTPLPVGMIRHIRPAVVFVIDSSERNSGVFFHRRLRSCTADIDSASPVICWLAERVCGGCPSCLCSLTLRLRFCLVCGRMFVRLAAGNEQNERKQDDRKDETGKKHIVQGAAKHAGE